MLEIGSIVYLKEGTQKLMIIGRGVVLEDNTAYDYLACLYPLGYMQDNVYYFNEENIDKVVFNGFHDEEEDRFADVYSKWVEDNKDKIKKGKVNQND